MTTLPRAATLRRLAAAVATAALLLVVHPPGAVPGGGRLAAQAPPAGSAQEAALAWIDLLREGNFDSAAVLVEPEVRRELDAPRLDTLWTQVQARLGPVSGVRARDTEARGGVTAVNLDALFAGRRLTIQVLLSPRREVMGFTLRPPGR